MKPHQVAKLPLGIYRLHWRSGGFSLASVGQLHNGHKWFACANWSSDSIRGIASTLWEEVVRAEIVQAIGYGQD
jgi:hypothetical protein